jgi:hypothetical protein
MIDCVERSPDLVGGWEGPVSRRRRYLARLTVLATACVGLGVAVPAPSEAGCVAPELTVPEQPRAGTPEPDQLGRLRRPVALHQGKELTVRGRWFFDECDDTGTTSGCVHDEPRGAVGPSRHVRLILVQGGRTWQLGSANADNQFRTRWHVVLPADAAPGPAVLRAKTAERSVTFLAPQSTR